LYNTLWKGIRRKGGQADRKANRAKIKGIRGREAKREM